MLPEDKQRGDVSWETYKTYIRLNGGWIFPTVLIFFMSCWMTLSTLANIQIQRWCQNPNQGYTDLWIYASFSIGSAFFAFARGLTLVLSGIKQGTIVHKKMIKGLLYASIPEFFDRVPTGRILNRVSKDLR
jgi:ATP-binding cassette subfamily C (CFTR/MRP) protein 1